MNNKNVVVTFYGRATVLDGQLHRPVMTQYVIGPLDHLDREGSGLMNFVITPGERELIETMEVRIVARDELTGERL